jgi:hypothetical protein
MYAWLADCRTRKTALLPKSCGFLDIAQSGWTRRERSGGAHRRLVQTEYAKAQN